MVYDPGMIYELGYVLGVDGRRVVAIQGDLLKTCEKLGKEPLLRWNRWHYFLFQGLLLIAYPVRGRTMFINMPGPGLIYDTFLGVGVKPYPVDGGDTEAVRQIIRASTAAIETDESKLTPEELAVADEEFYMLHGLADTKTGYGWTPTTMQSMLWVAFETQASGRKLKVRGIHPVNAVPAHVGEGYDRYMASLA